ncbi:unnamed protein product [Ilex paraguariensis]|uniref:c-Myc-binding protein homolog n=1 Tax=Ilex paraguariensis TaxID=185542 RepID=A0ABC8V435_9AQUA
MGINYSSLLEDLDANQEEKEAKKEVFRKYLESSGVLDALTKVLVALYEQNDKPSSAIEFIQQKLGGPTVCEYENLQAEMSDLQIKYYELLEAHKEKCWEFVIPPVEVNINNPHHSSGNNIGITGAGYN